MMNHALGFWTDEDLEYLIRLLMPETTDLTAAKHTLKSDPQILDAMLGDERLFVQLMDQTEKVVNVSGRLFFSALLSRARIDLKEHPFTFERDNRFGVVVFDASSVVTLLEDRAVRSYLAEMLASFVRIESRTVYVRVGNGTFRKMRYNDFDIDSLIEFSSVVDEEQQAYLYKRIGEICLFLIGIFSDYLETQRAMPGGWFRTKSKKELVECGSYYFRAATKRGAFLPDDLEYALSRMSEEFQLATKPLNYISRKYLGYIERAVFLQ